MQNILESSIEAIGTVVNSDENQQKQQSIQVPVFGNKSFKWNDRSTYHALTFLSPKIVSLLKQILSKVPFETLSNGLKEFIKSFIELQKRALITANGYSGDTLPIQILIEVIIATNTETLFHDNFFGELCAIQKNVLGVNPAVGHSLIWLASLPLIKNRPNTIDPRCLEVIMTYFVPLLTPSIFIIDPNVGTSSVSDNVANSVQMNVVEFVSVGLDCARTNTRDHLTVPILAYISLLLASHPPSSLRSAMSKKQLEISDKTVQLYAQLRDMVFPMGGVMINGKRDKSLKHVAFEAPEATVFGDVFQTVQELRDVLESASCVEAKEELLYVLVRILQSVPYPLPKPPSKVTKRGTPILVKPFHPVHHQWFQLHETHLWTSQELLRFIDTAITGTYRRRRNSNANSNGLVTEMKELQYLLTTQWKTGQMVLDELAKINWHMIRKLEKEIEKRKGGSKKLEDEKRVEMAKECGGLILDIEKWLPQPPTFFSRLFKFVVFIFIAYILFAPFYATSCKSASKRSKTTCWTDEQLVIPAFCAVHNTQPAQYVYKQLTPAYDYFEKEIRVPIINPTMKTVTKESKKMWKRVTKTQVYKLLEKNVNEGIIEPLDAFVTKYTELGKEKIWNPYMEPTITKTNSFMTQVTKVTKPLLERCWYYTVLGYEGLERQWEERVFPAIMKFSEWTVQVTNDRVIPIAKQQYAKFLTTPFAKWLQERVVDPAQVFVYNALDSVYEYSELVQLAFVSDNAVVREKARLVLLKRVGLMREWVIEKTVEGVAKVKVLSQQAVVKAKEGYVTAKKAYEEWMEKRRNGGVKTKESTTEEVKEKKGKSGKSSSKKSKKAKAKEEAVVTGEETDSQLIKKLEKLLKQGEELDAKLKERVHEEEDDE